MRILKGLSILLFFTVLFGSCFDQPEYSIIPEIEFTGIEFVNVPGSDFDSLILHFDFKDGDGDLGLDNNSLDPPFHISNYFLSGGNGTIDTIPSNARYTNLPAFAEPGNKSGKLVTIRTRNEPGYDFLPPFKADECFYKYDSISVDAVNNDIFDNTYFVKDTLRGGVGFPDVYILVDTFYYQLNPYHNNIEIDWLVKDNNGNFNEFDWQSIDCGSSFDGRFPVLADNVRPVEGSMTYAMTSSGFLSLFSIKTLKLRFFVRDRALHKSNITETPEFTLDGI